MPGGDEVVEVVAGADLRRALTTSLTPRLRDLFLAAAEGRSLAIDTLRARMEENNTLLHRLQDLLPHLLVRQRIRKRHQST